MEDKFLIIMLAVLVCVGFAAILFFSGFLNKRKRRNNAGQPEIPQGTPPEEKAKLLDEFDRTGVMCFDKNDKAADRDE